MQDFSFQTAPQIEFGANASAGIGEAVAAWGCKKVALVTDEIVLGAGLADAALDSLRKKGVDTWTFAKVVPDPPASMVLEAVAQARTEQIDGVVCVGGGSSMDTAKLMALLVSAPQQLDQIYGINIAVGRRLPLLLAPTTSGTGSEVTAVAVVTTDEDTKMGVVSPQMLPDRSVLDPQLTLGLPRSATAATGMDAMVHAIEAFTSKRLKNPMSDGLAKQALALLAGNIRTACEDPSNYDARSSMMLGSMFAGMAFANAPVAAVHALAYPIGGRFHVPHGMSNALVLPYVLEFNLPKAEGMYAELAPVLYPDLADEPAGARVGSFIQRLDQLREDLGIPTRLSDVGVSREDLPCMADDAMKQQRLLINNPREVTRGIALEIYEKAL